LLIMGFDPSPCLDGFLLETSSANAAFKTLKHSLREEIWSCDPSQCFPPGNNGWRS
jgi:hypothetical protein